MMSTEQNISETTTLLANKAINEAGEINQGEDASDLHYASIRGKETRNTVILAVAFYFTFTAFHALQNLESSLNKSHELGVISLSVLYGCFGVSAVLAPTVIRLIGIKPNILLAWVCHILFTSSNFYPSFYTLIPGSFLLGSASALLWTSHNTYIAVCADSVAKHSDVDRFTALSRLTGLFYTIFQTTQIPGNLISSLVLTQGSDNSSSSGTMCGPRFCPAPSSANHTSIAEPDQDVVYIMLGVFLVFNLITLLVSWFCLAPIPRSAWMKESSFKQTLLSYFKTLFTTRLVFLVPLMIYVSLSGSFLMGDFTRAWVSCTSGVHLVGFVMATYGACNCVSTLLFSRLARILRRYFLFGFAASIHCALFIVLYHWTPREADIGLVFAAVAVWSVADSILLTQVTALIGVYFPDRKEPAFANLQTWMPLGSSLMFAVSGVLCVQTKLLMLLGILASGFFLYVCVEVVHTVKTRRHGGHQSISS